MLDNLNMHPNSDGKRDSQLRPPSENPRVGDREVPINTTSPFDAMHRWLDGEAGEAEARHDTDSARYVALWRRIGAEAGSRRVEAAPASIVANVMSAIPGGLADAAGFAAPVATDVPVNRVAAVGSAAAAQATADNWWHRPLELNAATALATAAGLVALGLAMGAALRGN
ncbi:MAG: hypothetical protein ACYC2G_03120 [Gemmatimonadaceae bacterium]